MQDEEIFKISLITTIIGLIGLIITAGFVTPEELTINKIDNSKIDNQIQITGTLDSYTTTKSGTIILEISDGTGSVNAVIFPTTSFNMTFNEGMNLKIVGKVTQYKGNLELVIEDSKNIKIES